MFRTAGTIFAVIAIGTVAIAWSQSSHKQGSQPAPLAGTISPETLPLSSAPLSEQQFNDRSFVFVEND